MQYLHQYLSEAKEGRRVLKPHFGQSGIHRLQHMRKDISGMTLTNDGKLEEHPAILHAMTGRRMA